MFTFVQLREKVEFVEARRLLAARAGITLEERRGRGGSGPSRDELYRVNAWARGQFRSWLEDSQKGQVARDYLARRQLEPSVVERFGLGLAPGEWGAIEGAARAAGIEVGLLHASGLVRSRSSGTGLRDTFHNRLMFPICDPTGQVLGFGGRTLGDDRAKYLNTPETMVFDKGRGLYGVDLARRAIGERGRVIVVEGYTDCMMAHQHGFEECVATLGTALTVDQVRLLKRYADTAYLVFDSDEAGTRAADRGLEVFLTQQMEVRLVQVPEGKDPCDFLLAQGREAFRELLNGASSALEFKWRQVHRRYGQAQAGPERHEAIQEFLSVVATSAVFGSIDPIQRGLVLNEVSKLLAIPAEELHRQLARLGKRVRARVTNGVEGATSVADADGAAAQRRARAEQLALREVLEVLMAEPGYFDRVSEWFDPLSLEDTDLRSVAVAAKRMAEEYGEFDAGELIVRMEDARYARLITDLQVAGESRSNYEQTIESARRRIEEVRAERASREAAAQLLHQRGTLSEETEETLLRAVAAGAKARKGPLPLRRTYGQG